MAAHTIWRSLLRAYAPACTARAWASSLPKHKVVGMPSLSPTMSHGTIVKWLKGEGDKIEAGEALAEIETDKSTLTLDATTGGFLAKVLVEDGTTDVEVKKPIAVIVKKSGDVGAFSDYVAESSVDGNSSTAPSSDTATSSAPTPTGSASAIPQAATGGQPPKRTHLSPAVARILAESGLDLDAVHATGPRGHVLKGDVLRALAGAAPAASRVSEVRTGAAKESEAHSSSSGTVHTPAAGRRERKTENIPVSNIRKIIAKRLQESKSTVAHHYVSAHCPMDKLVALRSRIKAENGKAPSVNDFIVRAAALALQTEPLLNALDGQVDISVAVATEGGLITPIVKRANALSAEGVSAAMKDLVSRARENRLSPEEFNGGSFTISNLGMFGISHFSAIINPPQSCILAVGGLEKTLTGGESTGGEESAATRVESVTQFTLSCDQEKVGAEEASRFLRVFTSLLGEAPESLL